MHIYYPQIKIAHFCVQLTATSLAAACKTGNLLNVCHLCVILAIFVCTHDDEDFLAQIISLIQSDGKATCTNPNAKYSCD